MENKKIKALEKMKCRNQTKRINIFPASKKQSIAESIIQQGDNTLLLTQKYNKSPKQKLRHKMIYK